MRAVAVSRSLFDPIEPEKQASFAESILQQLARHEWAGRRCEISDLGIAHRGAQINVPVYTNEFWTSKQRAAHSLHEISYRACFKPQLPEFFIERLTAPGDVVYDPFMGRGTTLVEAALKGRTAFGCDINPLSKALCGPRLNPPTIAEIGDRLKQIDLRMAENIWEDLLVFYHESTLREICALRGYFLRRLGSNQFDSTDAWIRMVAVNRLSGHSPGFFSVYSMPPNQAVSIDSQRKINERRNQIPPRRDVKRLIMEKSASLLSDCDAGSREKLAAEAKNHKLLTAPSNATPELNSGSVQLVVTSPPFLDVVNYAADNWLRGWFCGIDTRAINITTPKKLADWTEAMTAVFAELHRVLKPGGHIAFEVGEVRNGKIRLEETVIPCGLAAGLVPLGVIINHQEFTKTANIWGVDNGRKGTNTNRIVLFKK